MKELLNWCTLLGNEYITNRRNQESKLNLFKQSKTKQTYESEQKCFATVITEACIGIQRIMYFGYFQLTNILDMNIAKALNMEILDVCINCIDVHAFQYLTHLALRLTFSGQM